MTCSEFLRHLNLFLDSECDHEIALALSEHLAACEACAKRAAKEKDLEDRLARLLSAPTPGDGEMWQRLQKSIEVKPRRRLFSAAIAAGTCLAAGLGIAYFLSDRAGELVRAAVQDHMEMVSGVRPTDRFVSSWEEARNVFQGKLPFSLGLEGSPITGLELTSARPCVVQGEPVAFVAGRLDGNPVTLLLFPIEALRSFPDAEREFVRKGDSFSCGWKGTRVGLARHEGTLVCAAGPQEGKAIEALAASVARGVAIR